MRLTIVAATLCTSILGAAPAMADDLSGNGFYSACKGAARGEKEACKAWVGGVLRGAVFQAEMDKQKLTFCIPSAATSDQILDTFLGNMEKYPDNRHLDAVVLLMVTMTFSFPCNVQK